MADEAAELIEAPDTCEDITEYGNRIDDEVENELEQELKSFDSPEDWEEIEDRFARYERNYRARRIRELTLTSFRRRPGTRSRRAATRAAA